MAGTDKFMEVGDPGTATTLNANYTATDTTVTVVSTTNWPSATGVIFAIDNATVVNGEEVQTAGTYNEFEGDVTSSTLISEVDWKRGAGDTNYSAGALTRVYIPVSAERENRLVQGISTHADQDGTLATDSVVTANITDANVTSAKLSTDVKSGWQDFGGTVTYTSTTGARSATLASDADETALVDEGMRMRMTRTVTPPTQCYDFELDDSQYANKSSPVGITFTDDFTCEAWIKIESQPTTMSIVSRYNNTSGWNFRVGTTGSIQIYGWNASSANFTGIIGDTPVPIGEWVHVAARLDMDVVNSNIWINGVADTHTDSTGGTNPTALIQAGDLEIGSVNSGTFGFDGKIAMVRVWSDIRTATEIQDNMSLETPASTTGLVDQWSLDGDLTSWSGSNTLTANGSPTLAAATDNPFSATEYGIITAVSGTTDLVVFSGLDSVIPNDATMTNVQYSSQKSPHGFNSDPSRWRLSLNSSADDTTALATWDSFGITMTIPPGAWAIAFTTGIYLSIGASVARRAFITLSADGSTETNEALTAASMLPAAIDEHGNNFTGVDSVVYSSAKTMEVMGKVSATGTGVDVANYGSITPTIITATCAYI